MYFGWNSNYKFYTNINRPIAIIAKINERLADNSELAVELMEDVTDSWDVDTSELDSLKAKYDELLQRYKDRFVSGEEVTAEEKEPEVVDEDEKVIDVQDIFEEEEEKKE